MCPPMTRTPRTHGPSRGWLEPHAGRPGHRSRPGRSVPGVWILGFPAHRALHGGRGRAGPRGRGAAGSWRSAGRPARQALLLVKRAGHTRITPAALRHTIETIAAHAFSVPRSDVAAVLDDDSGRLAARVSVKLALPPLLGPRRGPDGGTVFDRSRAARTAIIARGLDLTGRTLS